MLKSVSKAALFFGGIAKEGPQGPAIRPDGGGHCLEVVV